MNVERDPYPEIGNIVASYGREPWDGIVFEIALGDGWSRTEAVQHAGTDQRSDIDLSDDDLDRLEELFEDVRGLTREMAGPGQPDWTAATFVIRPDGHFDVEFGFDPIT